MWFGRERPRNKALESLLVHFHRLFLEVLTCSGWSYHRGPAVRVDSGDATAEAAGAGG